MQDSNYFKDNKARLCVITSTFADKTGELLLSKLLKVLEPISERIFVVTGLFKDVTANENIQIISLKPHEDKLIILKIFKYVLSQIKTCRALLKISKHIDLVLFYISSTGLTLPLMLSKTLRKKTILIVSASDSKMAKMIYKDYLFGMGGEIIAASYGLLEKINYRFADKIIVDSEKLDSVLDGYRSKVTVASERRFIDVDGLTVEKSIAERRNLIGYVGRLSHEKMVMSLVKAIPLVLGQRDDTEFLIVGEGPLLADIQSMVRNAGVQDKVGLPGWIPNSELGKWLNELKLLVLPSHTEGLPNIVIEAMACGTPVLATAVGALPEIIKDKETGFVLGDNTPDGIADRIIEVLSYPYLDKIARNARALVQNRFTYKAAVEKYRIILCSLAEGAG